MSVGSGSLAYKASLVGSRIKSFGVAAKPSVEDDADDDAEYDGNEVGPGFGADLVIALSRGWARPRQKVLRIRSSMLSFVGPAAEAKLI